jgi:hypothetical protein
MVKVAIMGLDLLGSIQERHNRCMFATMENVIDSDPIEDSTRIRLSCHASSPSELSSEGDLVAVR